MDDAACTPDFESPAGKAPTGRSPSRRAAPWIYLAVVAVLLGVPKLVLSAAEHGTSIDGGLYTDLARNVRDGRGLVTHVSPYHHGYPAFPHPTAIYPLWPLVYGLAARLGGPLPEVGTWLATAGYAVTVFLAYLWGRAFDPRELFPRALPGVHLGHVAAVAVGVHREFFAFTSYPYTEGLAYALLFGFLLRAHGRLSRPGWRGGVECGVLSALCFLARSQMILAAASFAAAGAFAAWASPRRGPYLWMLAGFGGAFFVLVAPYYLYVRSFVVVDPLAAMLRYDTAHVTPGLSYVPMLVPADGPAAYLVDRIRGLGEAFAPAGRYAYARSFGPIAWALPIQAVAGTAALLRRRRRTDAAVGDGGRPPADGGGPVARLRARLARDLAAGGGGRILVFVLAAAALLSIHAIHKQYYVPWNFARRQALIVVLAFLLAVRALALRGGTWARVLALVLCAGTFTGGVQGVVRLTKSRIERPDPTGRPGYRKALRAFLAERREREGDLVVILSAQEPQKIAWRTQGVGYHWVHRVTRPRDLAVLAERLGARYALVHRDARSWPVFRSAVFDRLFEPDPALDGRPLSGFYVYRRRDPAPVRAAAGEGASP